MDAAQFSALYQALLALLPKGVRSYSPSRPYFTGYPYGTLYDWDQYFEGLSLFYAGWPGDYLKNGIKVFLSRQEVNGFIARSVPEGGGPTYFKHRTHVKPFLAQECLLCLHAEGSLAWLRHEDRYTRLKKYLRHWLEDLDVRGAGLSVWREAEHTGMDNHYERAGQWGQEESFCEGVDLNCYLVREARAMALVAEALEIPADCAYFAAAAQRRAEAIQQWLWDPVAGLYYDFHAIKQAPIKVKYVGALLPLWSQTATPEQARRLVEEHLTNPAEFWRPYPLPALAASEPGYVEGFMPGHPTTCCSWRAHTWVPANYMVFQGLRQYGYAALARELAERTFELFRRAPFCEYYTAETGIGTGQKPFWGWSSLAIFMMLETELGADPTRVERHGAAISEMRRQVMHFFDA